jgi:hypothetical protein
LHGIKEDYTMKTFALPIVSAFVAVQLLQPSAASAASMTNDRATTQVAAQIIGDANSGRDALVSGNTAAANHDIDAALAAQKSMAARAHGNNASMIVPIYAELDDSMVLANALKTRPAAAAPAAATGTPPADTVRGNIAQITYVAIDLDKVKQRLDAAKLAEKNNNREAAEDALAAIGSDLIVVSDTGDVPLLTARQDLALAQHAMMSKQYTAASSDLHAASAALKAYAQPGHAAQASQLAADIQSMMPVDSQTSPSAASRIDGWWSSVKNWFAAHA